MKKKYILVAVYLFCFSSFSQVREVEDPNYFERYSAEYPKLNETIRIDMQGLTLYELITTIADENEMNVSADYGLSDIVNSNFYDIQIKSLFQFLVKRYSLQVDRINGVFVFTKSEKPIQPEIIPQTPIDVQYKKNEDLLSVNFKNDSLQRVARALTDVSGLNVILSPEVRNQVVSSYILNRPFNQVMEMMASSNNLELNLNEQGFYVLTKKISPVNEINPSQTNIQRSSNQPRRNNNGPGFLDIQLNQSGLLDIEASGVSATELIMEASEKINSNYFMYTKPDDVICDFTAKGLTYDDMLSHIFEGKPYTFKNDNGLYMIGGHTNSGLRQSQLVQLKNRTVETLLESLPQAFVQELEIKEFFDLNGFIVSGSPTQIEEFKRYIHEIDRVVPVVQIEVLIVQYQKGHEVSTGIELGLNNDNNNNNTSGVLLPSTQMNLNSGSVNDLIEAFNGLGWMNLGKVTEQFYANLRAMENNAIIKISSTPKLVTLNGHEASSSIGETNYYFEQNNRLINSGINDNILQSGVWKATDANLAVHIKPMVSQDEQITLKIRVEKNSFLGRAGENAPPGKATQSFESIVRVRNNEMVLLGGLDELERENSGSGAPLLSRIPIIKWFFSNRVKKRQKSKLHLFIKPTVIY